MGFRKLHAFNLAMLAKQDWRILNNLDLLVSQILKARYFPNDEFLNAKKRSNISFTWHSILDARPVIERGVRWRIEDVDMIKSIPLGNYALEDNRVWHFNKNGRFSVKSAYQVALPIIARESGREVGESSAPTTG
ncbi:hypothetical protein Sango_0365700 [Sesamum angolense]|uniref:Uncharacterized protein n=1 Tax=Sesamum angolense TaxID=2727404 RepID=A0AAE1XAF3_9LAMI|nr:hypothetical protein Sango_0365700 [Sesamum angolense]